MVLCFIALPIFAILGIFSVRYRQLTVDSIDCMFKTITLRKCTTGLDKKIKAHISASVFRFSPFLSKIIRKHFAIFSWLLVLLLAWSLVVSSIGVYNYIEFGNCNGPESTGFCVFDPTGSNSAVCGLDYDAPETLTAPPLDSNDPVFGNPDADLQIIYFGCYTCENTKAIEPVVEQILENYGDRLGIHFKSFVIPDHDFSYEAAYAGECALEQDKYTAFHRELFSVSEITNDSIYGIADYIGLDMVQFDTCLVNQTYADAVEEDMAQGRNAGIPGTPTFFIGDDQIVGTKPYKTFETIIEKHLE